MFMVIYFFDDNDEAQEHHDVVSDTELVNNAKAMLRDEPELKCEYNIEAKGISEAIRLLIDSKFLVIKLNDDEVKSLLKNYWTQ